VSATARGRGEAGAALAPGAPSGAAGVYCSPAPAALAAALDVRLDCAGPNRPPRAPWSGFCLGFLVGLDVRRLFCRDAVIALEPAAEIDIGAAAGTERLMAHHGRLAADRAAAAA